MLSLLPSNSTQAPARLRRLLAIALLLGAPVAAQLPAPIQQTPRVPITDTSTGFADVTISERQAKLLNIERQKIIVSDTAKILELARELNADAASGYNSLSPAERMHKADEIEKLAKAVREKMSFAIGTPAPANPYAPWQDR